MNVNELQVHVLEEIWFSLIESIKLVSHVLNYMLQVTSECERVFGCTHTCL